MPDYLALGSNEDFVQIPMNPLTAQRIADQTGTSLPTKKIVDDVYRQAEVKLREARRMFTLLLDERAVFAEWQKLVTAHAVTGKLAHDARLVAAMVRHGLTHVLTFNTKDFARFSPIQTLSPETIAAESAG